MKVVCNSTALIGLAKLDRLDLLKEIFGEIIVPEEVYQEIVVQGQGKPGSKEVKEARWIKREQAKDKVAVEFLSRHLNKGESEVLILGKELKADWLVIDDGEARDAASSAGFKIIGLGGILITAKNTGLIKEVKPLMDDLRAKKFRIGNFLYRAVLKRAGEFESENHLR